VVFFLLPELSPQTRYCHTVLAGITLLFLGDIPIIFLKKKKVQGAPQMAPQLGTSG